MSAESVLAGESAWCVVHSKWQTFLPTLPGRSIDVVLCDPPYSEHVHTRSRQGASLPDTAEFKCRFNRKHEFGFDHISQEEMEAVSDQFARLTKRWVLVFSDVESSHLWARSLRSAGLEPIRVGAWVKIGGTPQFTGDRPAVGFEAVTIAHRKGKKRWNGGGHAAVWTHPVEANRLGNRGARVHPAQKPLSLMLELVRLFSDEGEVVLDPYAGAATTGAACLRSGRRFIGCEMQEEHHKTCVERLEAESGLSTLAASRAGQIGMFST